MKSNDAPPHQQQPFSALSAAVKSPTVSPELKSHHARLSNSHVGLIEIAVGLG